MGKESIKTVGPEKSIVIFNRQKDWKAISLPVIAPLQGTKRCQSKKSAVELWVRKGQARN